MRRPGLIIAVLVAALCSSLGAFASSISYQYDALGRLVTVTYGSGTVRSYSFDATGNRTSVSTVVPSACTFTAVNSEGSDEFAVYAYLQRTGSCNQTVSVSTSIEYVSGTGSYYGGSLIGGPSISPSDQSKALPVYPAYGSVPPGSPLVLKVTWSVSSGTAVISPSVSYLTIYNSDCYC